jgi:hypothetical protein
LAKTLASPETIITLRGVGVIRIVSDSGNEYVLAHELMHTVLRRNNFPHWTGRLLRASYDAVMGFLGQLESTALHPAINKRLRDYQLDLPIEHANSYVERCVMQLRANEGAEDPIDVAFWSLLFAEMTMWNIETREQLQAKLRLPAAWALADEFLQIARGIETGSPQDCRSFALQAIRIVDEYLNRENGYGRSFFFKRIMFPPPPFLDSPEGPARTYFKVDPKVYSDGSRELEVLTQVDGTLCWAEAVDRLSILNEALKAHDSLTVREFADFCEERFCAIFIE